MTFLAALFLRSRVQPRASTSALRGWLAAGLILASGCGEASPSVDDYLPIYTSDGAVADAAGLDSGFWWDGGSGDFDASFALDAGVDAAADAGDLDASADGSDAGLSDGGTADGAAGDAGDAGALDASADASTDASLDASYDASTDAATDASLDASDAATDASDDASADAATDASTDGGSDAGVSFPRPGEAVNVAVTGPYSTASYDNGVQNAEYDAATVYYPTNASAPFAAVALCPGYLQTKDDLLWLAQMLASHGVVALTLTPTNNFAGVAPRVADLTAALGELRGENTRTGSPLLDKLDLTRLGVMGHGYGGAAALSVANSQGTQLRAVVPLASWDSATYPNVKAAALFVAAENDIVAPVASNALAHYNSIPAPVEKVFAELNNQGHYVSVGNPTNALKGLQTRHVLSFLKIYLEDDTRYETYVYGLEHAKDAASFSQYLTAP